MAELGSFLSPPSGRIPVGKFDQIEGIPNERFELIDGDHFRRIELAGHAAVDDGQGRGADVLAELEVFKEAETEAFHIVGGLAFGDIVGPDALDELAVLERADGVFPRVAMDDLVAFDDTAAGETQEAGV